MEMGEESEEYDVTLSCPAGQVWLANSDVMLTVELYICEHNFPVINLILFLLRAQNNRFEVCEMQGRACKIVDTTEGLSPGSQLFSAPGNMAGINCSYGPALPTVASATHVFAGLRRNLQICWFRGHCW